MKKKFIAELLGLLALCALAAYQLWVSWRKWPDPLIDFGRELYLPWRIAGGAVLYRDVTDIFGPLSQCFNAALFKAFGVGMMVLVTANLVFCAFIVAILYGLCRRAWGIGAALFSSAIFISTFAFSQFAGVGNYNFVTPYSHEATHGFLVCLMLVVVLFRWLERPTRALALLAGFLFGLSVLLKAEIILAAGLITLTAALLKWRRRQFRADYFHGALWLAGAITPTFVFAAYFAGSMPWPDALRGACTAWLNPTPDIATQTIQLSFLGFDHPWKNLCEHLLATAIACLLIVFVVVTAWRLEKVSNLWARFGTGALMAAICAWISCRELDWFECGKCLLGLTIIYGGYSMAASLRRPGDERDHQTLTLRLLLAVLAASLMARMVLNGRIYQYGFYQAALAGSMLPAIIVSELPLAMKMGRSGTTAVIAGALSLLVPGILRLEKESREIYAYKTVAIGEGMDRFYALSRNVTAIGDIVRHFIEALGSAPPNQTLLVLPEGEMINYLTRLRSPVPQYYFYTAATSNGREREIVSELTDNPPDWVVFISRDLRDYGISRYGDKEGDGRLILNWINTNYRVFASMGGDPLDDRREGGIILSRMPR